MRGDFFFALLLQVPNKERIILWLIAPVVFKQASTSAVQAFLQKLHKHYDRLYVVILLCRYVKRGSSSHWNVSLGFHWSKKVENRSGYVLTSATYYGMSGYVLN